MQIAEAGYYLSIPSALVSADKSSTFYKLAMSLPFDKILTETGRYLTSIATSYLPVCICAPSHY